MLSGTRGKIQPGSPTLHSAFVRTPTGHSCVLSLCSIAGHTYGDALILLVVQMLTAIGNRQR